MITAPSSSAEISAENPRLLVCELEKKIGRVMSHLLFGVAFCLSRLENNVPEAIPPLKTFFPSDTVCKEIVVKLHSPSS